MASSKIAKNVGSPVSQSEVRGIQKNKESVYRGLIVFIVQTSNHTSQLKLFKSPLEEIQYASSQFQSMHNKAEGPGLIIT